MEEEGIGEGEEEEANEEMDLCLVRDLDIVAW